MPKIHAFRRKEALSVDTAVGVVEFSVDASGDVVADVPEGEALDVLFGIPEAYKIHASDDSPKADEKPANKPVSYVLKNDQGEVDLSAMDEDALKAFAKANDVKVHHTWTGDKLDKLRQKLVDTFAAE